MTVIRFIADVLGVSLASIAADAIAAIPGGWMLMLTVGIVHAEWIPQLPTLGYWWAVLIVWLMRGVFSRSPTTKDD